MWKTGNLADFTPYPPPIHRVTAVPIIIAYQFSRYPWIEEWRSFTVIYNLIRSNIVWWPTRHPKVHMRFFFWGVYMPKSRPSKLNHIVHDLNIFINIHTFIQTILLTIIFCLIYGFWQPSAPPVLYNEQSVNGHVFSLSSVADPGGVVGVATPPPPWKLFFWGGRAERLGPVVETSGWYDPSSSYKCFPYIYTLP